MDDRNDFKRELEELEVDFYSKVSNLPLDSQNGITVRIPVRLFQKEVSKKVQINTVELSEEASRVMERSEELTDTEVAIELLKYIEENNKSKTMRKLASKMIKEKRWNKY
jgi:hypothetical protein